MKDAEGIASVHVASWKTTYKGIISDSYLSQLSVEKSKQSWNWTFRHLRPDEGVYVALNDEGTIVGFASGGRNRNVEFGHDGELYAIYLLKDFQGQGIGRSLFRAVVESLESKGLSSLMVWVLHRNSSEGFYKALGGKEIGRKEIVIGSERHLEIAYGWDRWQDIILQRI